MTQKVIIAGLGEVGYHVARELSQEAVDLTVIDREDKVLERLKADLAPFPVRTLVGNANDREILEQSCHQDIDLFLAVTSRDEINLIAALTGKTLGVRRNIARIKSVGLEYSDWEKRKELFGIDELINPYEEAAEYLKQLIVHAQVTELMPFFEGKGGLVGFMLAEESPLAGMPLYNMPRASSLGALVGVVMRGREVFIPSGNFKLAAGDRVYFLCGMDSLSTLSSTLGLSDGPANRVLINGGGHVGFALARRLEAYAMEVRILEINRERCDWLSRKLSRTLVLCADGADAHVLRSEEVGETDYFVSLTSDDSINIVSALLAKEQGAKHVAALVKQAEALPIIQQYGVIDTTFSPRLLTAQKILQYVQNQQLFSFFAFPNSAIEMIELSISADTQCIGKKLQAMNLPRGLLLGAIKRGAQIFIPHGDDVIQRDDVVMILQEKQHRSHTESWFGHGKAISE